MNGVFCQNDVENLREDLIFALELLDVAQRLPSWSKELENSVIAAGETIRNDVNFIAKIYHLRSRKNK